LIFCAGRDTLQGIIPNLQRYAAWEMSFGVSEPQKKDYNFIINHTTIFI